MERTKFLERFMEDLALSIKRQERHIKSRKRRPSGLHKREAEERELLERNVLLLKTVKRFANRHARRSS
jgi:hypothetical protein